MLHQYDYRPKWTTIFACAIFFGAGAVVLARMASRNHRGLILNGIVELSPAGATILYWALAVAFVGFVVIAGLMALTRALLRQRIAIDEHCLMIPRSRWSNEELSVPFGDLLGLSESVVRRQRWLTIVFNGGKFTLLASYLAKRQDYDEIHAILSSQFATNRANGPSAGAP